MMENPTITMLGTGNATVTHCYNTCFVIHNENENFLVDAGGGNGIMIQLGKAGIDFETIHTMFLTHGHTDHILGAIWVVRMIATKMGAGRYEGEFHIYANEKAAEMLRTFCDMTLAGKHKKYIGEQIFIHTVSDGEKLLACGMELTFFDIFSTKEPQFGFRAVFADGRVLACLGDEPFNEQCRAYVEGCDYLMSEAFCLYEDRERFKPYEKHHSTALDAGKCAAGLGAKNLILYHTEDKTLATRKMSYTAEAATEFAGAVYVPEDLEELYLDNNADMG